MGRASRRGRESRAGFVPGAVPRLALRGDTQVVTPDGRFADSAGFDPPVGSATVADLKRCVAELRELELRTDAMVVRLAQRGVGWGDIGRALGVSRQAARQRYGSR